MSMEARQALVDSPQTVFQRQSQRDDLLNETFTNTDLIAFLSEIVAKGHVLLFTAIRSDHHDDSALGLHCHANGYCADVWPLHSSAPTDYVDADEAAFQVFLADAAKAQYLYQIGLAGTAWTSKNAVASGDTVFHDDGADHVHLGAT